MNELMSSYNHACFPVYMYMYCVPPFHCISLISFVQGIDGQQFLLLSKEQIVNLTGMKVGPSLKIHDIIQALKLKFSKQSPPKSSESKQADATAVTNPQVTASSILQQQGLLQGTAQQRQPVTSGDDKAQSGRLLGQHLLKGSGVSQHSRTLQAQST